MTAEPDIAAAAPPAPDAPAPGHPGLLRDPWLFAVAGVVLLALVLRLWGIRYGLPFAYNLDERSHFVPRAVEFFRSGSLNPNYQLNPSGLIEWIALALAVVHRSSHGVVSTWNTDPGSVWLTARVASALLATVAVGLLYVAGARFFGRGAGLLGAAILATAFLPVHYGHLALNDAPSLAPSALALVGIAGVLRTGRRREYALAGLSVGLAMGLKYNAAFLLLPLLTAAAVLATRGPLDARPAPRGTGLARHLPGWRGALVGVLLAGVAALVGFLLCDPYAALDPHRFREDLQHLSDYTKGGLLLGETQTSGHRYYLSSLVWGFGVFPLLLTALGGVVLLVRRRWEALVLLPAPLLVFLFVGGQGRYFARYLMPIYPVMAIVAGAGGLWLIAWLTGRLKLRGGWATALAVAVGVLACAQGVVWAVHNDRVLSRTDTRTLTRDWMEANIPAGQQILVEPLVPKEWYRDGGLPVARGSQAGYRWPRFVRTREDIRRLAREFRGARRNADFANYVSTLFPGLIDYYRSKGVCWIVSGSMQSGRAFNNPRRVPQAIAYYKALAREADLVFSASPFGAPGTGPQHYFQYDKAFNYGPLRYVRPGPVMRVYRLKDCTPR